MLYDKYKIKTNINNVWTLYIYELCISIKLNNIVTYEKVFFLLKYRNNNNDKETKTKCNLAINDQNK